MIYEFKVEHSNGLALKSKIRTLAPRLILVEFDIHFLTLTPNISNDLIFCPTMMGMILGKLVH